MFCLNLEHECGKESIKMQFLKNSTYYCDMLYSGDYFLIHCIQMLSLLSHQLLITSSFSCFIDFIIVVNHIAINGMVSLLLQCIIRILRVINTSKTACQSLSFENFSLYSAIVFYSGYAHECVTINFFGSIRHIYNIFSIDHFTKLLYLRFK